MFPSRRFIQLALCLLVPMLLSLTACQWSIGQDQSLTQEQPTTQEQPQGPDATSTNASQGTLDKWIDFQKDIAPIFQEHCLKCHRGNQAKGGFDITDRAALLGYITPGSSKDSTLWTDYLTAKPLTEDQESLVMPPDGPLPKPQLALLKHWIDEGAPWPENAKLDSRQPGLEATTLGANASTLRRLYLATGYFHPAVVHFPIALLSLAGLAVALSSVLGQGCLRFAYSCLILGAFGSVAAAVMGWSFAEIRGLPAWNELLTSNANEQQTNEFFHRWLGTLTAIASLVVAWFARRAGQPDGTRPGWGWKIATLVLAALVGLVGHQGGEMVYGDIFAQAIKQFNQQ